MLSSFMTRRLGRTVLAGVLAWSVVGSGCSHYIGTTASSFLRRVKEDPDPNIRYLAYAKLGSPRCYDSPEQKAEAIETMIAKLKQGREPVASRAVILHSLGELREPVARDAVLEAINDPEPVIRIQACVALGKVGRAEDATLLARMMMTDTLEDCRIAAIEALAELSPDDPRIHRVLVNGMSHDDPATRLASLTALRQITRRDFGVDPGPWQLWLEEPTASRVAARSEAGLRPAAASPAPPWAALEGQPRVGESPAGSASEGTPPRIPTRDPGAARASYPPAPKPLPRFP